MNVGWGWVDTFSTQLAVNYGGEINGTFGK